MTATIPAPANLEDSYRLYLAALRETGAANVFDAPVTVDAAVDLIRREAAGALVVGLRRQAAAGLIVAATARWPTDPPWHRPQPCARA